MSIQNSIRLTFLFVLSTSLFQLGFAQQSEATFAYTASTSSSINFLIDSDNKESIVNPEISNPAFDFSQGVTLPYFETLEHYVAEHLVYPDFAVSNGIEGRVVLSLKLSPTGKVISATVEESLGHGCDEAALALVVNMPNWTPAQNYGMAVGAKQLVTIDFKLQ